MCLHLIACAGVWFFYHVGFSIIYLQLKVDILSCQMKILLWLALILFIQLVRFRKSVNLEYTHHCKDKMDTSREANLAAAP